MTIKVPSVFEIASAITATEDAISISHTPELETTIFALRVLRKLYNIEEIDSLVQIGRPSPAYAAYNRVYLMAAIQKLLEETSETN